MENNGKNTVDSKTLNTNSAVENNYDRKVIEGFGDEWRRFDQSLLKQSEAEQLFNLYFRIFPWNRLPKNAAGFDLGCGSGRWAKFVIPRVAKLHCIDASESAITVAQRNLSELGNCEFHRAAVDHIPLEDYSMDFGYSLGVLHHIPDTLSGLRSCVKKLKPGAPFLLYLYYPLDNRPAWFRFIWKVSNLLRIILSRCPFCFKCIICDLIAITVYWPLSKTAGLVEKIGLSVENIPLSFYRNKSFYVMRTDALDRFGTRMEKRFTRQQILEMMQKAGLEDIQFNAGPPYWVAVGIKRG